jgi:multidrug efflux system membrane fusion protein
VYVVTADKLAELRPVVVERIHAGDAVITKGLVEGETVVIEGQLRVLPGKAVDIKEPAGASGPRPGKGGTDGNKGKKKDREKEKSAKAP